jgi:hypothetical protein
MKTFKCVINGDDINRYGQRFTTAALERSLRAMGEGISMNLNHDLTMPVGWVRPLALYLEPGLGRVAGLAHIAENKEETQKVVLAREHYQLETMQKEFDKCGNEFLEAAKSFLSADDKRLVIETIAMQGKGLARRAFPKLFEIADRDKNGLVPLTELEPIAPGVFKIGKSGEFCVFFT